MKGKSTKSALLMSFTSLLLCFAMLIGCTFAWFTDSVTSGVNTIKAGNLDIELEYSKDMTDWKTVQDSTELFNDVTLWEPGAASVVYLKIVNKGTLTFKYNLSVKVNDETSGTNVGGQTFRLSDSIKFGQVNDVTAVYADRSSAIAAVDATAKPIRETYQASGVMLTETPEKVIALVVYMPYEVGNEANYRGDAIPTIKLGIKADATQMTDESDSFDNQYDKDAQIEEPALPDIEYDSVTKVVTINSAGGYLKYMTGDLSDYGVTGNARALNAKLGADIDFGGAKVSTITVTSLDGDNHSIKNAKADNYLFTGYNEGILGTVKNLTLENIEITGTTQNNIGIFGSDTVSRQADFSNITLKNCRIDGTNSEYAGALLGNVAVSTITNCKAIGCTVSAKKSAGALIGFAQSYGDTVITNCSAEGGTVTCPANRTSVGMLIGRAIISEGQGTMTVTNCTATGVAVSVNGATVAASAVIGDTAGYTITVDGNDFTK